MVELSFLSLDVYFSLEVTSEGLGRCNPIIIFWWVTVNDTGGLSFAARYEECCPVAQEVISKGCAAQDISEVGVSDILVWDAVVLVPTAPYVEPSKE
eukprot:480658-Pelagomonas_calceolata.AAC.1